MRVAIYCGASKGKNDIYAIKAIELGNFFAKNDVELVFGGGAVGLMGVIADEVVKNGGLTYGVIPEKLKNKELAHKGLNELLIVENMHIRKDKMMQRADAFVAMPGGAGTFEEIFEAWTWMQLGYHRKPCAFYNVNGFYDKLLDFLKHVVDEGFMSEVFLDHLIVEDDPKKLYDALRLAPTPPTKF